MFVTNILILIQMVMETETANNILG